MTEQVWEGTWEEIKKRGEGLANRRVRLILLSGGAEERTNGAANGNTPDALAAMVDKAEQLEYIPSEYSPSADPHEKAFGEIVAEKYRKQGFNV